MDWETAVKKSSRGVAQRFVNYEGNEYLICRWQDGHTKAYTVKSPVKLLQALESWSDDHDDWIPAI